MIVDENLKTKMSWNYSCGIVDARIPLNPREPDAYRPGACALMRIRWNDLRKRFEVVGDPNEKSCVWFCNEFWIHMRNEIFVGTICSHPDEKKAIFEVSHMYKHRGGRIMSSSRDTTVDILPPTQYPKQEGIQLVCKPFHWEEEPFIALIGIELCQNFDCMFCTLDSNLHSIFNPGMKNGIQSGGWSEAKFGELSLHLA